MGAFTYGRPWPRAQLLAKLEKRLEELEPRAAELDRRARELDVAGAASLVQAEELRRRAEVLAGQVEVQALERRAAAAEERALTAEAQLARGLRQAEARAAEAEAEVLRSGREPRGEGDERVLARLADLESLVQQLTATVSEARDGLQDDPLRRLERDVTRRTRPPVNGDHSPGPAELLALQLRLEGGSRRDVDAYLRTAFGIEHADEIVARVFGEDVAEDREVRGRAGLVGHPRPRLEAPAQLDGSAT